MNCSECRYMEISSIVTPYRRRYKVFCRHPETENLGRQIGFTKIGTEQLEIKTHPKWCKLYNK